MDLLPPDVAPYITLQLDVHTSYLSLNNFVLNYTKVMKSCRASWSGAIHLLEKDKEDVELRKKKKERKTKTQLKKETY